MWQKKNVQCQESNNYSGGCRSKHSEYSELSTHLYPGILQDGSQMVEMDTGYSHWWRLVALLVLIFQFSVYSYSHHTWCIFYWCFIFNWMTSKPGALWNKTLLPSTKYFDYITSLHLGRNSNRLNLLNEVLFADRCDIWTSWCLCILGQPVAHISAAVIACHVCSWCIINVT